MVRSERNSDVWLLSLATTALFIQVAYLFWLLRVIEIPLPIAWTQYFSQTSNGFRIGEIVDKRLAVRNRTKSSLTWTPMASGDPVHGQDTLMTGMGAAATIQLSDGTRLEMGPNSLIHFPINQSGAAFLELELNRGKIRLLSGGKTQRVHIRAKRVDVKPESEVVLQAEPVSSAAQIDVVQGHATIPESTENALVELRPGEQAVVTVGGKVEVPTVAERALAEAPKEEAAKVEPVPEPAKPQAPSYQARTVGSGSVKENSKAIFVWAKIPKAKSYVVEVATDAAFKSDIVKAHTTTNRFEWMAGASGNYYWRVTAEGEGDWLPSAPLAIRVKARIEAPKTTGAKVLHSPRKPASKKQPHGSRWKPLFLLASLLSSTSAWAAEPVDTQGARLKMEFHWGKVPGARRYLLQVSATPKFESKLLEVRVSETRALVELPKALEYFWRVAGIDADGDLGNFSDVTRMDANRALAEIAATVAAEEKIRAEQEEERRIAALPPPTIAFSSFSMAYGGGWATQRGSSGNSQIEGSGFAWNSLKAGAQFTRGKSKLDLVLGYQPWKYLSQDPEIADFQPTLSAYRLEASALFGKMTSPWFGGLRYRREGELQRTGAETVSIGNTSYFGLVLGRSWVLLPGVLERAADRWIFRAQLEASPIGRRGVGTQFSSLYNFAGIWDEVAPIWEVSLYPYYRQHSLTGRPEWTVEWNTWLWICWNIDGPPKPSIPTKVPSG
jgi:hypothetical protein